jgi:RNase P/RNase MRP subunit p29
MNLFKILYILCLTVALGLMSANSVASASVLNKHQEKLLGSWVSAEGKVVFNANNMLVYKGKKSYYAIAQGTIQISKKKTTQLLPYRFIDGKLIITDEGQATTYTRAELILER